jgi:predicted dehydrogenase
MAIRIAIVGMGARGQQWLREVQRTSQYALGACVDVDRDALLRASRVLGLDPQQCFSEAAEAFETNGVDAVLVATPADCHVQTTELALSHGLPVIVEKPFATNLRDAFHLVSLAEEKHTPLIVAQNYRYMRSFRTARRLIAEGTLGRVSMVVCQYYRVPHQMAESLARLPNSILWGIGVHHLDVLRYILGKDVSSVVADSFSAPWGSVPGGASMRFMLTMEDGTRVFYTGTYESSGHEFFELGQEFYARFTGERATLHIFQRWLVLCERGKLPRFVRRGRRRLTEEQILLDQLVQAIRFGREPDSSGRDNLKTMAVVEACVRSAAEQKWIKPKELLDEL